MCVDVFEAILWSSKVAVSVVRSHVIHDFVGKTLDPEKTCENVETEKVLHSVIVCTRNQFCTVQISDEKVTSKLVEFRIR